MLKDSGSFGQFIRSQFGVDVFSDTQFSEMAVNTLILGSLLLASLMSVILALLKNSLVGFHLFKSESELRDSNVFTGFLGPSGVLRGKVSKLQTSLLFLLFMQQ